jgi:hypothetical protein
MYNLPAEVQASVTPSQLGDYPIVWVASALCSGPASRSDWLPDSVVTSHMTANQSTFISYKRLHDAVPIETADGRFTPAIARGDVAVETAGLKQILSNVYHVPGLRSNLVSVPKLVSRRFTVHFHVGEALVLLNVTVVARARRCGACYVFTASRQGLALAVQPMPQTTVCALWHRRLGHAGRDKLDILRTATTGLSSAFASPRSPHVRCLHAVKTATSVSAPC